MARNRAKPKITLPIWKRDGKLWTADPADVLAAIEASGHSEALLRRKLGAGYDELMAVIGGKRITGWAVSHLEWGLAPDDTQGTQESHSWPPRKPEKES